MPTFFSVIYRRWIKKLYWKSWIHWSDVRPLLSLFFLVSSLLIVAFIRMEERRAGYQLFRLTKEYRSIQEEKRERILKLARLKKIQNVERIAQKKTSLGRSQNNQIIYLQEPSL